MVDTRKRNKRKNRKSKKKKNQQQPQQQQQQHLIDRQLQHQHQKAEGIDEGVWGTTRRIWRALKLNQKLRSCVWDATTLLGTHFMEQTLAHVLQLRAAPQSDDNNNTGNKKSSSQVFWELLRARLGVDQFNQIMAKADRRAAAAAAAAAARAAAKDSQKSSGGGGSNKRRSMMSAAETSSSSQNQKRVKMQQEVAELTQRLQGCLLST